MLVCPLCRITLAANESVCPRDGQAGRDVSPYAMAPGLGKRFHVVEPFAHGSTGTLYLADEPETGRRGILKVLGPAPRALQAERQRLRRELTKQATLEGAYIVSPFATGETDGQFWIFREWLEGVSLRVRITRQGALPQAQAFSIAAQLAVALDDLHRAGLLHRDLKPGHILLDAQPEGLTRVRVVDSGLCAPIEHSGDATLLGTPGFVAPEQLAGKLVSFRSDLYALGAVLYEMLTGKPAFVGDDPDAVLAAQREGRYAALPSGLPDGVSSLLRSLLGKDPQDRPFSAQKLRRTLDPYLPDGAAVTRQPTQTFANVSDAKKATPREPTGTLRPPAAPSVNRSTLLSATGAPNAQGRLSAPPPPPPSRPQVSRDSTQRLEIEQILSTSPIAARTSAPPPPPPARGSSAPLAPPPNRGVPHPTARGFAAQAHPQDPTEAIDFAEILDEDEDDALSKQAAAKSEPLLPSDMTQPIRLEQVLAVGEARARRSLPPPQVPTSQEAPRVDARPAAPAITAQPEPSAPSAALPVAPVAAFVSAPQTNETFDSGDSEPPTMVVSPLAFTAAQGGSDLSLDQTIERPAPRVEAALVTPADDEDPDGDEDQATSISFKPAALALSSEKPTLRGTGGGLSETPAVTQAHASEASKPSIVIDDTPTSGYERSEARHSAARHFDAEDETLDNQKAFAPFGDGSSLRQYAPYAIAAVLLLGIGGALIASLSGGDEDAPVVASVSETGKPVASPPPPSTAAAAPTVAALPLAEAPKTEPIPSVAPIVEAMPPAEPTAPRVADREARETGSAAPSSGLSRGDQKRQERVARTNSKAAAKASAKASSGAKSADSSEARWAKAREEAQAHYAAKRYKEAAKAYDTAAKHNPTHAGTFAGLGASRLKSNDAKGAVAAYQKAVQLSPSTSGFHAALGRAYAAQGDKSKARAAYKRALELDPKNEAAKVAMKELG